VGTKTKNTIAAQTNTKLKLNLPATLATGGIPVFRRVKEDNEQTTVQMERFIRMYGQNSLEPIVEISQFGFDYSFLGEKITVSSFMNINTAADELRNMFLKAIFDDSLNENNTELNGDQLEISCRLIYLSHNPKLLDVKFDGDI
jgi:hypothetical protein